eukprot:5545557-Prymnesium_polylepis.1
MSLINSRILSEDRPSLSGRSVASENAERGAILGIHGYSPSRRREWRFDRLRCLLCALHFIACAFLLNAFLNNVVLTLWCDVLEYVSGSKFERRRIGCALRAGNFLIRHPMSGRHIELKLNIPTTDIKTSGGALDTICKTMTQFLLVNRRGRECMSSNRLWIDERGRRSSVTACMYRANAQIDPDPPIRAPGISIWLARRPYKRTRASALYCPCRMVV